MMEIYRAYFGYCNWNPILLELWNGTIPTREDDFNVASNVDFNVASKLLEAIGIPIWKRDGKNCLVEYDRV